MLFDRLSSFVYQSDLIHSQAAKLQIPLAKGSGNSTVRVFVRGYANIDETASGTVIIGGLGQPIVFNPLEYVKDSTTAGASKRGAKKAFAQKRSLGMPPRPATSEGKDYLFETKVQVSEEAGLLLHLILMSNKVASGDEGAYIPIDAMDVELTEN